MIYIKIGRKFGWYLVVNDYILYSVIENRIILFYIEYLI